MLYKAFVSHIASPSINRILFDGALRASHLDVWVTPAAPNDRANKKAIKNAQALWGYEVFQRTSWLATALVLFVISKSDRPKASLVTNVWV